MECNAAPGTSDRPLCIAMWSGPRNISTAMMRAWENREDTVVCDEPLYAHYLACTGRDHPGIAEILAEGPVRWEDAVAGLTGPVRAGIRIFYQKHMTHHLLPTIDRDWLDGMQHGFLIREPREVLLSYIQRRECPDLEELGFPQQVEIFERVKERTGRTPPVLDARDVLEDPEGMLRRLCQAIGVPFSERMLSWPAGPRSSDGVWAKHWYDNVERSTGFQPYRAKTERLPDDLVPLYNACVPYYETLYAHRLGSE